MRSAAAGAAVLSAGLLLSACGGGDDGPAVLPPVASMPPVTSTSPTPSSSAFPDTPQGAAAFARFVYAEIDRAYAVKDPDVLRPLFSDECTACARFVRTVTMIRDRGLTVIGGTSRVLSAETPGGQTGDVEVSTRSDYAGVTIKDAMGKVLLSEPAGEVQDSMTLRRTGEGWAVVRIVTA